MSAYTADPVRYDLVQVIGDTLLLQLALADADEVPHDLTGATIAVEVVTKAGAPDALNIAAEVTDADGGLFELSATAEDTAELAAGTYRYAVRITWPDETVRTVLEGTLYARPAGAV